MSVAIKQDPNSRPTVLIVDDEEGIRSILEKKFFQAGYSVEVAANGKHALQKMQSGKAFNLLICDLKMPMMTGVELMKELRAAGQKVPVLIITGHPDREWIKTAINLGMAGVLLKPFKHAELFEKVQQILAAEAG